MVTGARRVLAARSLDALASRWLGESLRWRLHSVFDRAVNLVGRHDGAIVAVVGPGASDGPATVVLRDTPPASFLAAGLSPGADVSVEDGQVAIADHLSVTLASAALWEPRPARMMLPSADVLARVRTAERIAAALSGTDGLAPLLGFAEALAPPAERSIEDGQTTANPAPAAVAAKARTGERRGDAACYVDSIPSALPTVTSAAWTPLMDLERAWRRGDSSAVEAAARRLSGLGPGLTPSGDDLLAGFAIGYQRASGCPPLPLVQTNRCAPGHDRPPRCGAAPSDQASRRDALDLADRQVAADRLAALERAATTSTTDLAAARVAHAASGRTEETFEAVLRAVLGGNGADLSSAVERATRVGHSSGLDTLVGLFLGIRVGLAESSATLLLRHRDDDE